MRVIRPGTEVVIGDDIPATVDSVQIKPNDSIMYEVTWWNGKGRNTEWLHPFAVSTDGSSQYMSIGFTGNTRDL